MPNGRAILTDGPVGRHLATQTRPMIWGILAMMAFNAVDTWFVAQLGERELAAMSFTFPVIMVLISVGIGLMAGTSSVLARKVGAGDEGGLRRVATDAIVLSAVLSVGASLVGLFTIDPLFRLLGAPNDLLPLIREYMLIWYGGLIFVLVPMVGMAAMRALGDAGLQSRIMMGAALLNAALDPLLIFGLAGFPRLELQGAAIATVVARAMTLVVGFWALHFRRRLLSYDWPGARQLRASFRSVLHVGLPAAGTNIIIPLGNGVVVAIIAQFGAEAVAGYGAATRIEQLSLVPFFAMSAIIGPFVGQNLGANQPSRIREAVRRCAGFCLLSGLLLTVVMGLCAPLLLGLFSSNSAVTTVGIAYLWIVSVSFGAEGIVMVTNAAFNGLGRPIPAVAVSAVRMLVLYVPLAYAGGQIYGVAGVFGGATIANLVAGILAFGWFENSCRRRL
jgi:putative MATE family efflux protein